MIQRLPLVPSVPNYRFGTNLDGITYIIDIRWNGRDEAWYMDLYGEDETPIRMGMKIALGMPLGRRSAHPDFPDALIYALDLTDQGLDATYNDLGIRVAVDYIPLSDLP